jgi:hypothetical protein
MWNDEYQKLSGFEKEEFRRIANHLLSHTYMVRYIYQTSEQMTVPNPDYRSASQFFSLLREYFSVSGWHLEKDDNYGIMSLINTFDHNRLRIDRFTTLFLYTCRMIYEEGRKGSDMFHTVKTRTGDVVEKMRTLGLLSERERRGGKTTQKERLEAQRTLAHYNIIQKMESSGWDHNGNEILILPAILLIVSNQGINDMMTELEELKVIDGDDQDEENSE